ncbi:hypothetical protein GWI33_015369 [Rhynchophorus ferrugineus]|uniref:Uncharacterized protein n=1 Tax=Rhynchophorus ferrugineus TaxID=354439 RepID=A0A834M626_RHYFE|nr:hypothetical protein GWI33_015369 [Rhynchophorus ferrugineus]
MSLNKLLLLTIYFDVCLRDCAAYQYFFSDQNGGYRYGYNTENGAFATPEGFPNNVLRYNEGHSQGYDRGYITPILTSQSIPPRRPTSRLPPRIPNSNTLNRVMFTLGGQLGISGQADIPYAHRRVNDAAIFGSSPSDKYIPYSFVFNTGNHQREEARDGQGIRRTIKKVFKSQEENMLVEKPNKCRNNLLRRMEILKTMLNFMKVQIQQIQVNNNVNYKVKIVC